MQGFRTDGLPDDWDLGDQPDLAWYLREFFLEFFAWYGDRCTNV